MRLRKLLRRLGPGSLQADRYDEGRRSVNNLDAQTAARANDSMGPLGGHGAAPPNYVDSYDEGRPRH